MQALLFGLWAFVLSAAAAVAAEPLAKGIQDNSFLIEEAYNQEAGHVQHIFNLRRQAQQWQFSFSQEWPIFSQTHQFSYTVPYNFGSSRGVGDVTLNYRYQAQTETDTRPAIAPRVALVLPSADQIEASGPLEPREKSYGYELLLPVSKIVSDRVTLNGNAGLRSFFDVAGHQPTTYRLGGSAIYAVTRDFNLLVEAVADWVESVNPQNRLEREFEFTLLPGFRQAFNFADDAQLVVGAGVPILFSNGSADVGAFFYLSFEHKF
jgi:hypothetical protein